jgi:inner membrane protein
VLLFGHLGITLGIIKTYENLSKNFSNIEDEVKIDYRYVLIGAMLPDFIDKPLVLMLSNSPVHSARYIAHSLTFALFLLLLSSIIIIRFKSTKFLILTVCSYIHLLFDKMWLYPKVLLWPLYLLRAKNQSISVMTKGVIDKIENAYVSVTGVDWVRVYSKPEIYIPELIGVLFITYYLIKLIFQSKLKKFIETGKI